MEYIKLTHENLETEHICCAISSNRDVQVASKKAWLKERFDDGLVFLKGAERGKCFIEYLPAENAWVPIRADGYLYIDCFWVSGALKGHGYAGELLAACIAESREKGKAGLCVLSSAKKRPFLSDPGFLTYKGFTVADESEIGVQLLHLSFAQAGALPQFTEAARHPRTDAQGYTIYYTSQCPYTAKYVPILEAAAKAHGAAFQAIHLQSKQQAQSAPTPCTSFSLFRDGRFVTNEIPSEKKFLKMLQA